MSKKDVFAKIVDMYSDNMCRLRRKQSDVFAISEAVRTLSTLNIPIPKKLSEELAKGRAEEKDLRKLVDLAQVKVGKYISGY